MEQLTELPTVFRRYLTNQAVHAAVDQPLNKLNFYGTSTKLQKLYNAREQIFLY